METKRRICLYGNSVILGTLGASLSRSGQFETTIFMPPLPGVLEVQALKPDVVIFDLEAVRSEPIFSLLEICPGLIMIGISPDKNLVKVWSGRQLRELSTGDLLTVINDELKDTPVEPVDRSVFIIQENESKERNMK